MPPKGTRGKKGKGKTVLSQEPEPVQPEPTPEETDDSYPSEKAKRKTVTAFSEQQKEEIIEFLKSNEVHGQSGCIYTRRGPVVAQIVITLDHDREKRRDHNRMLS